MASAVKSDCALAASPDEAAFAKIARLNPSLNVFIDVVDRSSFEPVASGLLADFTVAVKANIAVKGLPFSAGMAAFRNRIAEDDATAVALLRASGARVLGTVNMAEAALGATTNNPHFGRTENPLRPGFTAGGSSGGSAAAVAAGLARIALGSDTMGSCRIPAAYCGVVGFKPSAGWISMRGVEPLCMRLDSVGVLTANVSDARLALQVLAAFDRRCAHSVRYPPLAAALPVSLSNCRFTVLDEGSVSTLEPTVAVAYRSALQVLKTHGATLISRTVDRRQLAATRRAGLLLCEAELAVSLAHPLAQNDDGLSPDLRQLIAFGQRKSAPDLASAGKIIDDAVLLQRILLTDVDAILWPTTPQTAFSFDDPVPTNQADFTCLANFTGAPALSLPLPRASGGASALPAGLQLMCERGEDANLFDLARAAEHAIAVSC
jgi:Asp-tRNA(Asn)/Glu-tRNA(Gln) amidotransferase A subunit family amidase